MANPRHIALDILCRVEAGAYADRLLASYRQKPDLTPQDHNFLQQIVCGTLTWQGAIDHTLKPYLKKPLAKQAPRLRNLLRLSAYQIRYLDRTPSYAVVSEAVFLAKKEFRGLSGLVNAVLRGLSENRKPVHPFDPGSNPVEHLSLTLSHPPWLVSRWIDRYGPKSAQELCHHNNTPPPLSIRPNILRSPLKNLQNCLSAEGISTEPCPLLPDYLMAPEAGPLFQTQAFQNGLFSIQNPAAGLVIRLLDPQPGQQILDLCSAPGGKTTAIAERFDDSGLILATDLYPGRLFTLLNNCRRLGLTSIFPIAADGNALPTSARFHRVLVDAPCSSLGILNHHPEIRWHRQESDLTHLARRQSHLLQSAAQYVCPDGLLVYSTCTLEPEENERVVETFLKNHTGFRLEPASEYLDLVCDGPYLSILPHQHHLDGTFAARLRKVA